MINPLSISHKNDRKLNSSSLCFHRSEDPLEFTHSLVPFIKYQTKTVVAGLKLLPNFVSK